MTVANPERAGHRLAAPVLALALGGLIPHPAQAADTPELQALRMEVQALRTSYERRLQALEQKLAEAQAATSAGPALASAATPSPEPSSRTPVGNSFNPALGLILSGRYQRSSQDPANYRIRGFALPEGGEAGPGQRGFSLGESELVLSANIDPWWRGALTLAIGDGEVAAEEAYVATTALPAGLGLKAGRFFSGIGYLNSQHAHTWDFIDNPLAYQALLGTQHGDDGLQLRWVAPTDTFLEFGAELGRGRSFPGDNASRNGAGMGALYAHVGGDWGDSHSWRAGLSWLRTRADGQRVVAQDALTGDSVTNAFTGNTQVWVADAVWKWAPRGNATDRNFKLQGEYLRSHRQGELAYDVDNANVVDSYRASPSGWYLQAVYQFMRGWRLGVRTERLNPGTPDYGLNSATLTLDEGRPQKNSLMLDWTPSEFSRVRLQYARDQARPGPADQQWSLQYQMSLGAHGAHNF